MKKRLARAMKKQRVILIIGTIAATAVSASSQSWYALYVWWWCFCLIIAAMIVSEMAGVAVDRCIDQTFGPNEGPHKRW